MAQTTYQSAGAGLLAHPKFWPTWIMIGLAWLISACGHSGRRRMGRFVGRHANILFPRRAHIVKTNLMMCFPELADDEVSLRSEAVMASTTEGLLETGLAWLHPTRLSNLKVTFEGLAFLDRAPGDPGILILGMHFATLDLAGALLAKERPFHVMYKTNRNPVLEWLMQRGRGHYYPSAIDQNNIRQVIRYLKAGKAVWYAPDQDYGHRNAVFPPFFGQPAATLTAANRMARMTGARVVFMRHYRQSDGSYRVIIEPPMRPYPTTDDLQDAALINQHVEQAVLEAPEQYWWVHRRFKSTPHGGSEKYLR
jgi:KDO2-lipid IV(A) lauroyltransferase